MNVYLLIANATPAVEKSALQDTLEQFGWNPLAFFSQVISFSLVAFLLNKFAYTSAEETLSRIASVNSCEKPDFNQTALRKKDFEPTIAGAETRVENLINCAKPTSLWRIEGGLHSTRLPTNYAQQILTFISQ